MNLDNFKWKPGFSSELCLKAKGNRWLGLNLLLTNFECRGDLEYLEVLANTKIYQGYSLKGLKVKTTKHSKLNSLNRYV